MFLELSGTKIIKLVVKVLNTVVKFVDPPEIFRFNMRNKLTLISHPV